MNENLSIKISDKKEAVAKLFENRFDIHYDIIQDNDCLSTMSQGKKSLVLLQLLIEMDNSKCPILLDQPEDDLDNRSIYNELVKFIKHKKKERQIIIATHNPNLVVGADAECVIVAHQLYNSTNNSYKFEYVSGALENTFTVATNSNVLYKQGIQEHVCEILEGGREAFQNRKNKYQIS
jgi:ABC-type lipoprotein export system ATPase subunit